MSESIDN